MGKRAIYSCITLQKELENTIKKIGFDGKVTYLNVALHSDPQKMHETLQRIIDENTEAEEIVICVSGCGKATCDLKATTCPIAVPRTMDCIDVLLTGSGIKRPDGAIFYNQELDELYEELYDRLYQAGAGAWSGRSRSISEAAL